jgi:hypothetical protein
VVAIWNISQESKIKIGATNQRGKPIAIKTAVTVNSESSKDNANSRIRNSDYVITLPSLLDSLNLQSNKGSYQREFKKASVAIKGG